MNRFQKDKEIVHDLLLIQQERANAYQAMQQINTDGVVCKFLDQIAMQCRNGFLELRRHIDMACGDPADRIEIKGDIYREWPGVKPFKPGSSGNEIIAAFEWNEVRASMAYQRALTVSGNVLSKELLLIIYRQLKNIRESFSFIHEFREKPTAPVVVADDPPPHFTYSA